MSDRSKRISSLLASLDSRASYVRSKLGVLVPSQIRSLRLKSNMPRQSDLAREAKMQQSRISMFETPGAANLTLDTLSHLAAAFKVGLIVKFAPFSEMLKWENEFDQDTFNVTKLNDDVKFLQPAARGVHIRRRTKRQGGSGQVRSVVNSMFQLTISGGRESLHLSPAPQEGVQMGSPFEPSALQAQAANVIALRSKTHSIGNPAVPRIAAAIGGNYGR